MTAIHSRRSIVAGLAAAPALSLPAVAAVTSAEPDPIFNLIQRYYETQAACDASDARSKAGEDVSDDETEVVSKAQTTAFAEVLSATPLTLSGAVAQLRCMAAFLDHTGQDSVFETWFDPIYDPGVTILNRLADVIEQSGVRS